ncbi:hypothetical protein [Paraburkholderia oxyphila]|uniref:hypothetical protein n=1 Tax=Paraburkholderia oxyphila TaxID=614212 RepID=UPI000480E3AA|nr:hypothetical protein [Paraburkholderia oxyphila]
MNASNKGDVSAFVHTAERTGGWVWVISLVDFAARDVRRIFVSDETYTNQRAAKDAGDARLEALAHDQ